MNVMVLAAGEGTRFRPYTLTTPKPAIPFLSVPLAAFGLQHLQSIKIKKMVVNTYHLPEKIVELFQGLPIEQNLISFSHEQGEIQGSGGGLGMARTLFKRDENIIMMNADEVILPHQSRMIENLVNYHTSTQAFATLLAMDHPEVGSKFGGVWCDSQNRVFGFGKHTPDHQKNLEGRHFLGIQILSYKVFNYIDSNKPSNILYDVLTKAMQAGEKVVSQKVSCTWHETGNLEDYKIATQMCLDILKNKPQSQEALYLKETLTRFQPNWTIEQIESFKL